MTRSQSPTAGQGAPPPDDKDSGLFTLVSATAIGAAAALRLQRLQRSLGG